MTQHTRTTRVMAALTGIVSAFASLNVYAAQAQTDHKFASVDVQLHGRLYSPPGGGRPPVVLYVAGSGDYSLLTDAYAQNTVRAFVDRGLAVFVFDKRGIGQSGGRKVPHDLPGKTADVKAALDFLKTHRDIDSGGGIRVMPGTMTPCAPR